MLVMLALATLVPAFALAQAPLDSTQAVPQRDIMDILAKLLGKELNQPEVTIESRRGLSYVFLPSVGYNPSYGAFIGVSVSAGGSIGDPRTTTPSIFSAGVSYSTTHQTSVQIRSDFYLPNNTWKLSGDWRYLDTTEDTYGLGPAESGQPAYPMAFTLYRFYQVVYKRLGSSIYNLGLGYLYDGHENIEDTRAKNGETTPYSVYSGGTARSVSSGVSFELLVDTRDNPINATHGVFVNTSLRSFSEALGGERSWQGIWSEFRTYVDVPGDKRQTFALWNYFWLSFGHAPYFDLPATTWDRYGRASRGYLRGRIRGQNQIYTEGEYRRTLTRDGLLGAVGFFNVMATTASATGAFGSLDPGGGVGVRLKFNKKNDTNAAMDFAWGDTEKMGIFFGLQEVF